MIQTALHTRPLIARVKCGGCGRELDIREYDRNMDCSCNKFYFRAKRHPVLIFDTIIQFIERTDEGEGRIWEATIHREPNPVLRPGAVKL